MADGDKLYLDWELRGTLEEQIKEAIKDTEKLQEAIKKASDQGLKIDASKFADNFKNNIGVAEKALYKLMEAKEKADKAIARNAEFRKENIYGFDDSRLQHGVKKLDEIIEKLMHIGAEAVLSKNHVKDLLADLSADVVSKSVTSASRDLVGEIEKEERSIQKSIKDAAKAKAKADKDDEDAAARNIQNQQKVQDAMAKIATARANLSKASDQASEQERMHVQLLLNLLDRLSSKLAEMRKQDLGGKGALDGVLGSGYQGLMRNVMTAISDITSGRLNMTGMSDEAWNAEKLLATRKEITNTFNEEFEAQEKVNRLLRERQEMEQHRKDREAAKDEAEVQAITKQINRELAEREKLNKMLDANKASYMALDKIKLDTESQQSIAIIRNQTVEYTALQQKLTAIEDLMKRVKDEEAELKNGTRKTPSLTKEVITQELDKIQRQYNETLARGKQALLDEADAEKKNADAKKKTAAAAREVNRVNADMVNSFNKVLDRVTHNSRMLGQLQQQFSGFVGLYGVERLLKNIIQIGGEFEVQHIALQSILGDVQQANSMFEQMKELAVVSPFNFRQLAAYSKQIAAFNIPYEEMYDTTKRLADMAAGLGVDMGRLILAYGQVRSAAVLRGQELRQFTEAGIPMVQALANEFTKLNGRAVSTAEVFELISKRAVPFEMVKKVMWDMTNEGGRFFDMQFVLSDTLAGKWSNLQDAWEIMLSEFAKGESLSGQLLKSMVTLMTKLTETVNTLMPLLAGGGLFYMMKKAQSYIGGMGLSGIDANIKKAQQLQAIELRRKLISQEITAEEYKRAMAMNSSQAKYYILLANEGKLKNYQIQRLVLQKQINLEKLKEMVTNKEITRSEAAQVMWWIRKNGEVSAFQMRMKSLLSGGMSFLKANGWLIAIDVAITALTTWYAKAEEAKAKNEELTKGFQNSAKELKESYASLNDSNLVDDSDYKSSINGLKEQLKQHSANYEAILREANSLGTLKEQYEYLKNALKVESEVLEEAEGKAEKFGETTRSAFEKANEYARYMTTGRQGFWDVLFGADTDVERGLEKSVKKIYEKILEVIPDVGKNEKSNELYRKMRNSMEEQLGFGSKERMLINIKLNELFQIDNVEDATTLVVDKFSEMLAKAAPEIANKIRYGQELNDAEKDKVAQLVNEATEETKNKYPYYATTLQNLLNDSNFIANIQLRFSTSGKSVNDFQKWIYGNMDEHLSEEIKQIATGWGESGNSFDAQNTAKRDIDASKNELEARKKQTALAEKKVVEARKQKKSAEEIEKLEKQREAAGRREIEAKTLYENRVTAAQQGLGYDYEGELKKSNKQKSTSSSKKDQDLERAKERLDFIKKFYTEYKKYRDQYGPIRGQSLVEDIFGMEQGKGDEIIKDYKKAIQGVFDLIGNSFGTTERKKFQTAVKQLLGDIDLDQAREDAKKYADAIKEEIQRQGEQWNLYKELLGKTGNKTLAMGAFANGTLWNEQAKSMAESLKTLMSENVVEGGNILVDWDAEEKAAEEYFKKNFKNGEALFEMWKAIVNLLRNNYSDALKENAEAWKTTMTYADRIAAIMAKYKEPIEKAQKTEDGRAVYSQTKKRDEELAQIRAEQLRDSINWDVVFGNMEVYSRNVLIDVRKNIKDWIKLNRNKADIKTLKEMVDAAQKLDDAISEKGGIFSGLSDAKKNLETAKQAFNDATKDYLLSVYNFGINSVITNDAKERMRLAQQGVNNAQSDVNKEGIKTMNSMTSVMNSIASLGKKGGASLSEVGGAIGSLITALAGTNSAVGNLISAIFSLLDAIGDDPEGFAENLFKNVGSGIYGVNSLLNINNNLNKTIDRWAGDDYPVRKFMIGVESLEWMKGPDDSSYQEALARYKELIDIWNKLIDQKRTYLEESWGSEGLQAGKEMLDLFENLHQAEKELAKERLSAGASTWSHSMGYRMWKGSYKFDGQNWVDVAGDISSKLGVKFDEMADMTNMTSEQLKWIREHYAGLWSKMDTDFREHLENIIEYGEQVKDTIEKIQEKLTGWNLDAVKSEWADLLATMENGTDELTDNLEKKLRNAILNSMIDNLYTKRLQDLIDSASQNDKYINKQGYVATHHYDAEGNITDTDVASEFTKDEYNELMAQGEDVAEDVTAIRDLLKGIYGWTDDESNSSSSSGNIGKAITEQESNLWSSYLNTIRADVSVNRMTLSQILSAIQNQSQMPVIAQSQLDQLRNLVELAKVRNTFVSEIRDILHRASNGGDYIRVR